MELCWEEGKGVNENSLDLVIGKIGLSASDGFYRPPSIVNLLDDFPFLSLRRNLIGI